MLRKRRKQGKNKARYGVEKDAIREELADKLKENEEWKYRIEQRGSVYFCGLDFYSLYATIVTLSRTKHDNIVDELYLYSTHMIGLWG